MLKKRWVWRLVLSVVVVAALVVGVSLAGRSTPAPRPAKPVDRDFSAYVGVGNYSGLTTIASTLGQPMTYGTDCFDDRSWEGIVNDVWLIHRWKGKGYPMVWCVPMLPFGNETSLAIGATGAYDTYFVHLARILVSAGMGASTLRIGWEFNNPKYPWFAGGQAAAFVAYWRHIVDSMRLVQGARFNFVWNVSRSGQGPADATMGNYASYYPGDKYVDVVSMDVYDQAFGTYPGATVQFENILTLPWGLNWLVSFAGAHRKKMSIPEFGLGTGPYAPASGPITQPGLVSGGDDPTFVTDMFNWARLYYVDTLAYWDYGSSSIENGQNPQTAAALRAELTHF
ncbi:MAG TPA: glycosyl hydrolase [Acidimicrobiales bacterium]